MLHSAGVMPVEVAGEKIVVTIAATTLTLLKPYIQVFADIDAHSILVFADMQESPQTRTQLKFGSKLAETRKMSVESVRRLPGFLLQHALRRRLLSVLMSLWASALRPIKMKLRGRFRVLALRSVPRPR